VNDIAAVLESPMSVAPAPIVNVRLFSQFNSTGVGRHCENAFFSMERHRSTGMLVDVADPSSEAGVRRVMAAADTDVTLFFWRYPPEQIRQVRGRKILWWFFESDRLPRHWLDQLQPYDQVWAPSPWAREVLLAHGIADEQVRVVESGVNAQLFCPAARPAHEGFIFLCVGKYEKRKSIDEVIEAFVAEFPAADCPDVQLWLKVDFPLFPERAPALAARLAHDPRLRVVSGNFSDEQMADLYRTADAFVFASKAEGFGLPLLEAMACGTPAIATRTSAQAAFLDCVPDWYRPVDFAVEPIVDEDYAYFYAADYGGTEFGNWAVPSVGSIRQGMREVYSAPQEWRERALRASAVLRGEFSWDAVAKRAVIEINALTGRAS
jgi:glycosyltransferase involved in cell wall biosynthesis